MEGSSPNGSAHGEKPANPLEAAFGAKDTAFRIPLIEGCAFLSTEFPPITWLVPHFIPKGALVFFAGEPESYKTFFAFALMTRMDGLQRLFDFVECDMPVFNEVLPSSRVAFIEEEMNPAFTQQRLKKLYGSGGTLPDTFYISHSSGIQLANPEHLKALRAIVVEKKLDVVFLDPFVSVAGVDDESANAEISTMLTAIRKQLIDDPMVNCTVVFIHHPAKNQVGRASSLRGAGEIMGKADIAISFKRSETDPEATITVMKYRLEDRTKIPAFKVQFRDEGEKTSIVLSGIDTDKRPDSLKAKETQEEELVNKMTAIFPIAGCSKRDLAFLMDTTVNTR
mgnify:CR=1 FL=1